MSESNINMVDLLTNRCDLAGDEVFKDDYFRRVNRKVNINVNINARILTDCIINANICHHYISLSFSAETPLRLIFQDAEAQTTSRGLFISTANREILLWLPKPPVARIYDDHGRIEDEIPLSFEVENDAGSAQVEVNPAGNKLVEFSAVSFDSNAEMFFDEINSPGPIELRKVMKGRWLRYNSINDMWNFLINGTIYKTQHTGIKRAWQCQQLAFTLYNYISFLAAETQKTIYSAMGDIIAYSVMLSLPANGRWRHGSSTDTMETHARLQGDGIYLLLLQYEKTGQKSFLEKAFCAADYLITLIDRLQNGNIWLLHDTLETNLQDCSSYYKGLFKSGAFGKSPSNTLCLNTHIWTLIVLRRLNDIDGRGVYDDCLKAGTDALKEVLEARRGTAAFYIFYKTRDLLVRWFSKNAHKRTKELLRRYDKLLKKHILPCLKKKYPRLNMPNGYIERDLCASALSDGYHFITLRDLLMLYNQTRLEWLGAIIKKSVDYSIETGLARYTASFDPRATVILEIISLFSYTVDDRYLPLLPQYTAWFEEQNLPMPVDLLCHPLLARFPEELKIVE